MQPLEKNCPAGITNDSLLIPPMVYQTWEDNFFGKTHLQEMQQLRALNPDMTFKLLDRDELEDYMKSFQGRHPILGNIINAICANYENFKALVFSSPKIGILAFTATDRFTKVIRSEIGRNPKIIVVQAGIDFNGTEIYVIRGSRA